MIVCHCTGTTDRKIRQAVESGARSCPEVGQHCSAGTVCGGCTPLIECMVEGRDPMGRTRSTRMQSD